MPNLSDEDVLRWQKNFKDNWGVSYTLEETAEATHNLLGFFQLLLECDIKQNPYLYKKQKHDSRRSIRRSIIRRKNIN